MLDKSENASIFWFENSASNVIFLEYNDTLICFDSSLYPSKFEEMKDLMESKTGKKLGKIFLTHWHPDHSFGAIFSDSNIEIVMNYSTYDILSNLDKKYLKNISKQADFNFSFLNNHLNDKKLDLFEKTNHFVFDNQIVSANKIGIHTTDSTIYFIKPINLLISGDLIFSKSHPEKMISEDNIWKNFLDELAINFDIKKITPGHGKPGDISLLKEQIEYLSFSKEERKTKFKDYQLTDLVI
ncbi:MBL fold metallo-hydrolase [Geotoga petraea]|uniref:Glyoxylase, beta-lactamase superfamily II n=1 Tax=Geotoga petraea TaxID=28234 RepID=A0A1G6IQ93_9BACT|nr:MBL fold metallo-hydrolase [Geotoga petraea]SDC08195.1 Glyoxylase, beta-lactamase superfamily II [Geotoga petraea]